MGDEEPVFTTWKKRGEWVEMLFMARAAREGLQVSKPYGDSAAYDFIVESGATCSRIQVKSTACRSYRGFTCCLKGGNNREYEPNSFDFVAVHVIPASAWFIIPPNSVLGRCIFLRPGKEDSKYHQYEEAWQLLKPPEQSEKVGTLLAFTHF